MPTTQETIAQQLHKARALELALARTLDAHVAMAPDGPYRALLTQHLRETRAHADRIARRLADLGRAESPLETGLGLAQRVVGQLLALGKAPLDLVRGASRAQRLLESAQEACASEALEIATYAALETLARVGGDERTAQLAADHRADEERMLRRLRAQLPALAAGVVGAPPPAPLPRARPRPPSRARRRPTATAGTIRPARPAARAGAPAARPADAPTAAR